MCHFFSCWVLRDGRIIFTEDDSHERTARRAGMREKNLVDYGGLQVGRVEANVILGDGGWVEFPLACDSESAAVLEFQRITAGLDRGMTIKELLPGIDLPAEILTAWVK
jgi:hypothetical protein